MKVTKMPGFGGFGAIVEDFDWQSPQAYIELKELSLKELVVVVKGKGQDNFNNVVKHSHNTFVPRRGNYKWALKYGPDWQNKLTESDKEVIASVNTWGLDARSPGWSRVSGIKNEQQQYIGAFPDCELHWHNDEPGAVLFYPLVVLYGVQGVTTSATCFVQTSDWYDGLTESFRSELNELVAEYDLSIMQPNLTDNDRRIVAEHYKASDAKKTPLVVRSPGGHTGVRYAFIASKFEGMSKDDSAKIISEIKKALYNEKYRYDYWWEHDQGDLLIIDNSVTMHQRIFKDNLDYKTELSKRNIYRSVADVTGHIHYDPYLIKEYSNLRQEQIKLAESLNQFSVRGWPDHLAKVLTLSNAERISYMAKLSTLDREMVLANLKNG